MQRVIPMKPKKTKEGFDANGILFLTGAHEHQLGLVSLSELLDLLNTVLAT